jgi:hypothetical protein
LYFPEDFLFSFKIFHQFSIISVLSGAGAIDPLEGISTKGLCFHPL